MDHFDIVERVEMGQMASMFFHKGNYSICLQPPNLTSHQTPPSLTTCNIYGGVKVVWDKTEGFLFLFCLVLSFRKECLRLL